MTNRRSPLKSTSRGKETRTPKSFADQASYMSISFLYFQNNDTSPAQSLNTWNVENRLLDILNTLHYVTSNDITQLQSTDSKLTLYGNFPEKSVNEFSLPSSLENSMKEGDKWGVLRNIGGQKPRIAGFLRDNIFYIVYLDKDHKFYKSQK